MAIPKIDWVFWNQPSIAPVMKAVIHFPLGDVICTDDDISIIDFKVLAFDSTYSLFGPPQPGTGSISFVDYEQRFNPTYNSELVSGIKIDLFLGLNRGYGSNLVQSVQDTIQVRYEGLLKYAVPFITTEPLKQGETYRLSFTYTLPDGEIEVVEVEDVFEELFEAPTTWPYSTKFALVAYEDVIVNNLSIQPVLKDFEPYGVFYSEDWEYDSASHEATVNVVDGMSDTLILDNRRDALKPSMDVMAQYFLEQLLDVYMSVYINSNSAYKLKYSFYEETQAATINNLVIALGKMLFFMPDGSLALSDFTGFYDTGIILTDDDVEAYDILQTSAVTMDSAYVEANLPVSIESSELASFSNIILASGDTVPLNTSRVMSVDYLAISGLDQIFPMYDSTVLDITFDPYGRNLGETFETFKVYGNAIETSAVPVYNTLGSFPYEIKENPYIQTVEQAYKLVEYLDDFIDKSFRIITVSLRGCYGLWVGAKLRIYSDMYNINAEYVVIDLDFSYNGAVSTTLTLQRVG